MPHRLNSYNDRNTAVLGERGSTALCHGGRLDLLGGDGAAPAARARSSAGTHGGIRPMSHDGSPRAVVLLLPDCGTGHWSRIPAAAPSLRNRIVRRSEVPSGPDHQRAVRSRLSATRPDGIPTARFPRSFTIECDAERASTQTRPRTRKQLICYRRERALELVQGRLEIGGMQIMASFDYGRAEIDAFNSAARAGSIHYEESAVREAVALYDKMIAGLLEITQRMEKAVNATGFGGFESSKQLQQGFSTKAADGISVVQQLIEGAMRLQEAYLRAGGMIGEADQRNADMMRYASETSGIEGNLA
ncbi:hypothetical protein APR08_003764 [Nocardia amikacinitolerans]|nr:hypothetical protein [Nocardia amikacinitolerans]